MEVSIAMSMFMPFWIFDVIPCGFGDVRGNEDTLTSKDQGVTGSSRTSELPTRSEPVESSRSGAIQFQRRKPKCGSAFVLERLSGRPIGSMTLHVLRTVNAVSLGRHSPHEEALSACQTRPEAERNQLVALFSRDQASLPTSTANSYGVRPTRRMRSVKRGSERRES